MRGAAAQSAFLARVVVIGAAAAFGQGVSSAGRGATRVLASPARLCWRNQLTTVVLLVMCGGIVATTSASNSAVAAAVPAGLYVASSGSDTTGNGSISRPFATLAKAQATMRRGGPQITYVRRGFYPLPAVTQNGVTYGLYLTAADNGQTWSYYPPDGYNSAILDGGSISSSTGIKELIMIDGASKVTINGLQLQHFRWVGIGLHGGSGFYELFPGRTAKAVGNTIKNNVIHDGSYDTSPIFGYGGGAFYAEGNVPTTTATNNAIYGVLTSGVEVAAGLRGGDGNLSSLLVANNVILSTCLRVRDCGSIYVQDTNSTSTDIRIRNNFIRDSGPPTATARSIYLDDGVSGATVTKNISTGAFKWAFTIHGGSDNAIVSNVADMGPSNRQWMILLYQGDGLTGMTGNSVQSNLIVSGGGGGWYEGASFGAQPSIKKNVYYRYAGPAINTSGLHGLNGDSAPIFADPQLSCWSYVLPERNPIYDAPASFVPPSRDWGPPGYTVPKSGTPPSQPHSC